MKQSLLKLLAVLFAFSLIAAACGDDDDAEPVSSGDDGTEEEAGDDGSEEEAGDDGSEEEAGDDGSEEEAGDDDGAMEEEGDDGAMEEGDDGAMAEADLSGTKVTIFGSESSDVEAGAFQDALDIFSEQTGIEIEFTGARDFSDQINAQAAGGNPPDIGIFPQPGKVADFARDGFILPIPDDVAAAAAENWTADWNNFYVVDGAQYAVPNKSDLKSLVWYKPARFAELGYEIPQTFDAFIELVNTAIADGVTPLCVGIESGPATGWPFTDWTEEMVLRFSGAEVYDQWVTNELPFNDPAITGPMQQIIDLWNTEGAVFAAGGSIAATPFGDNAQPLLDDDCLMHRQANFFASFFPAGTAFADGSDDAIDVFYFPSNEGSPILVAGTGAAAFRDAPEVWAVMSYLASGEYADNRQAAQTARQDGAAVSGFLSGATTADPSLYSGLEASFLAIINSADVARYDASDLMPTDVGGGSFWTEGTSIVNGDKTVEEGAAAIQDSWPS